MQPVQRVWKRSRKFVTGCTIILGIAGAAFCQAEPAKLGSLEEKSLGELTSAPSTGLGNAALSINPAIWKHAETDNFVYHYANSYVATPVSVEAESYYRVIVNDLGEDASPQAQKCHIYIFEDRTDWSAFKLRAEVDPWSGGIHSANELFILRDPAYKFKGSTLAHEVAHLVVARIIPGRPPLWLSEGYAEYAASRAYAAFYRARGYAAKPNADLVDASSYIPLETLFQMGNYPGEERVDTFYDESHRLVRFLSQNKAKFLQLFKATAGGQQTESALVAVYGSDYATLSELEENFKAYALDH